MASFKLDISDQCAPLVFDGSSTVAVALSAGGTALLTLPNIPCDGKAFTVRVSGTIEFSDTNNIPEFGVALGNTLPILNLVGQTTTGRTAGTYVFNFESSLTWSSVAQHLIGNYQLSCWGSGAFPNGVVQDGNGTLPSQSDVQFFVFAESSTGSAFSADATLTLTEFSLIRE